MVVMKISKNWLIRSLGFATLIVALPVMSSCGVFSDNSKKHVVTGSSGETTKETEAGKTAKPTPGYPVVVKNLPNVTAENTDMQRGAVESEKTSKSVETKKDNTTGTVASTSINGEWTIYSVRNNVITGEERPFITFDLAANRMYGNNGCNVINGTLKLTDPDQLQIEDFITTMRMCQDVQYEYLINLALADVRSYAMRNEGADSYLDLRDEKGTTVIVLRRHNMDFLNGPWAIVTLNGTAMPAEGDDRAASIVIDIPELRVHGNTGCNVFNGSLFIDPDKQRSMQFSNMAITRMYCGPESRETELLIALEATESAKLVGDDTVEFYDASGKPLMTLKKIVYPTE